MSAVLDEVPVEEASDIVTPRVEEQIKSAARLISAGANSETILRTMYLFGVMDGMLRG